MLVKYYWLKYWFYFISLVFPLISFGLFSKHPMHLVCITFGFTPPHFSPSVIVPLSSLYFQERDTFEDYWSVFLDNVPLLAFLDHLIISFSLYIGNNTAEEISPLIAPSTVMWYNYVLSMVRLTSIKWLKKHFPGFSIIKLMIPFAVNNYLKEECANIYCANILVLTKF